ATLARDARPLIERLRALERVDPRPGDIDLYGDPQLANSTSGLLRSGGAYYIVAGSTVTPETWRAPRRPGPGVLVVSAQRMDGQFIAALKQDLRVREASLARTSAGQADALPFVGLRGQAIGAVTWE